MLHPVVLSGGSGTRLWPLSRHDEPKQFLRLIGDHTLYQDTIRRVQGIEDAGPPVTVCSEAHRFMVGEQLRSIGVDHGGIVLEPVARNTAPAIALAALHLQAADADAMLLVVPADHRIENEVAFRAAVRTASTLAAQGWLVTFGIEPDAPETGYGYIRLGTPLADGAFEVGQFIEKPALDVARRFVSDGRYAWNSGMFVFSAGRYLEELELHAPGVLDAVRKAYAGATTDLDFTRVDAEAFARSPAISVDYAVMEATVRAAVVPVRCGWNDIGSWSSLWSLTRRDADGNHHDGDVISLDCRRSLVRAAGDRLVATIGVEDLVVIDTVDATLVAHRSRVQDVKAVVEALRSAGRVEHLRHRRVRRPWGSYETIASGPGFQVKRIEVTPGAALSLQKHSRRAEHWVVVSGSAEVTCDERVFDLEQNQSTYIPLGSVHRLRNRGPRPVEIIEVQSGEYLGEDDIVRIEDAYGRS